MSMVWAKGPTKPADRLMLLALADNADDCGLAWPGMERLAAKCCVTTNAARRTVRRLEEAGWVSTVTGGGTIDGGKYGRPSRYQIAVERLQ